MRYLILLLLSTTSFSLFSAVIYVNIDATGTNSGTSWTNAYTDLQNALSIAFVGDEIWVAAGVYKPTTSTNRSISFVMRNGVNMYGGFAGTESAITERIVGTNFTTLSGDIAQLGDNTDNTKKIVKIINFTTNFTFDGFRINSGYDWTSSGEGAGAYISSNSGAQISIVNCVFYNNKAYNNGGGLHIQSSNVTFTGCEFLYNVASYDGGGAIYSDNGGYSNITIYDSKFIGNSAPLGAVIEMDGYTLTMDRVLVTNNTSSSDFLIRVTSTTTIFKLSNSLIVGNLITAQYGGVLDVNSNTTNASKITNVTIAHNRNSATIQPYYETIYALNSPILLTNCIVYNNTPSDVGAQVEPGINVVNCLIQNGYSAGTNVLNTNPFFANPSTLASAPFNGSLFDYSLSANSPCINFGVNSAVANFTYDFSLNARIQQSIVDLGALESPFTDTIFPVANCKDTVLWLNAAGTAQLTPQSLNVNSSDNSTFVSLSLSQNIFNCSNVGVFEDTLYVTDPSGNQSFCLSSITIIDTVRPIAITNSPTVFLDINGNAVLAVNQVDNGSYDICGLDTMYISDTSFNCSDLGNNTIVFTLIDVNGNIRIKNVSVLVNDLIPPVAQSQNITAYVNSNGYVSISGLALNNGSTDNCTISTYTAIPNSFTCSQLGLRNVVLSVKDQSNNTGTMSATVTVLDTITPVTIGQNIQVNLSLSNPQVITTAVINNGSYDNCSFTQNLSQTVFTQVGIFPVTLTTTDPSGNSSSNVYQVEVVDINLGLEESNLEQLAVYPNPADSYLEVSTMENFEFQIFTIHGSVVSNGISEFHNQLIRIDNLVSGLYILHIKLENGASQAIRFEKR